MKTGLRHRPDLSNIPAYAAFYPLSDPVPTLGSLERSPPPSSIKERIDSLKRVLGEADHDTTRIKVRNRLSMIHGKTGKFKKMEEAPSEKWSAFPNGQDGIEIKGDKKAVAFEEGEWTPFTTLSLEVKEGDHLQTLSDGYADQFGGPKGKKFRYRPFKELLASLSDKALAKQKKGPRGKLRRMERGSGTGRRCDRGRGKVLSSGIGLKSRCSSIL